jgi:hypothetical protein
MKRTLQDRLQSIGFCAVDDPMFPDNQNSAGGGEPGKAPAPGNGTDPNAADPLTLESAAALITASQAPLLKRLEELGETTAQVVQSMNQTRTPANQPEPNTQDQEDFLTQFGVDPEAAVNAAVSKQLGTLAPLIGNLMNSGTSAFVGLEAQQIDAEFGAGAWNKLFDKPLAVILDGYRQNNAMALSDRNVITNEVNGLKGKLFNELVTFRTEAQKTNADTVDANRKELTDGIVADVTQRTNLTGGLRRIEGMGEEVTEELKQYLAERVAATGEKIEPKEWLARTDYGNSIEEYNAHQEKLKAAEKGTQ